MQSPTGNQPKSKLRFTSSPRILLAIIAGLIALPLVAIAYVYVASPSMIRHPKPEHYHFRLQIMYHGRPVVFASTEYQTGYSKDQCKVGLTTEPIHFHDDIDQLVHIHWEGMTGGLVLKDYGWDLIGGTPNTLGYRFDLSRVPREVSTHGDELPRLSQTDNIYVYTGDEAGYRPRSLADWLNQDLEQFFGVTSNSPLHQFNQRRTSFLNWVVPAAEAHDEATVATVASQEELTRINNLLGNVVVFVQPNPPSAQQVRDRFHLLVPLKLSTCGG